MVSADSDRRTFRMRPESAVRQRGQVTVCSPYQFVEIVPASRNFPISTAFFANERCPGTVRNLDKQGLKLLSSPVLALSG